MTVVNHSKHLDRWRVSCVGKVLMLQICIAISCSALPVHAVVQFQKVFIDEYIKEHEDKEFAKFVKRKARCFICHQGKGGKANNVYGSQLATLLDHERDKKDVEKIAQAIRSVADMPFDSADPNSESFAERIAAGKLPGGVLEDLKKPAITTIPLFDGKTLDGWKGDTDSYEVRNGILASLPGASGNLYTKDEYSDFVLKFDFRLTSGANNGIGIRAPQAGDAAYVGIELQVLDNTAKIYSELKPYQYHGSVYGVAPAKRGSLKPVGQWNAQEVRCVGREITVVLNDETILDINLDKVAPKGKTIDGRDHPGLKRTSGHIVLLGHDTVVEFRNLSIQDLSTKKTAPVQSDKK